MSNSDATASQYADRVIRVFISSIFRDMMQERDLLVKQPRFSAYFSEASFFLSFHSARSSLLMNFP